MSRVLAILVRLVAILAGYAAAALAASAFLHLIVLGPLGLDDQEIGVVRVTTIFTIPFVALFVAYFAFLPALPAILLGEVLARRDWLYWALAGAFAALVISAVYLTGAEGERTGTYDAGFVAVITAAGLVGGLGYWLVAGLGAGGWQRAGAARLPEARDG